MKNRVDHEKTCRCPTQARWCIEDAKSIRPGERDDKLQLESRGWPGDICPEGWRPAEDHLYRFIDNCAEGVEDSRSGEVAQLAAPLRESILRFPSARIRGVQRLHEYHNTPPAAENMHTYRILTAATPPTRLTRVFLFHNGLNELDRMGLYYQLASQIIASNASAEDPDREGVACILRPFPGHLTRTPFARFAEEPLHRYLWDGSYLFSQFLRYMIETQWFLSAMVRRSRYRSPSGAELLAENDVIEDSRLSTRRITTEISKHWQQLHTASRHALDAAHREGQARTQGFKPKPAPTMFRQAVTSLRGELKLAEWPKLGSELAGDGHDEEPSLHVIGYSLGGFTAQSVFMSWPFVISSCVTLLSGGALRELAPTAFAHPEEWQTVLHSLRYELDEGMLNGRYRATDAVLAGMNRELFHHLQRTFYEVFEQEYRGSYESRVAAFRQRMLFVVGGDDPIVRPKTVLDAAPAGGINLLEIGGLGHFLGSSPRGDEEKQQRRFWLPEVGSLIGRFSSEAMERHSDERQDDWLDPNLEVRGIRAGRGQEPSRAPEHAGPEASTEGDVAVVKLMSNQERVELSGDGALPSRQFGVCLSDMLARQHDDGASRGHLLVLRNELPTMLLPSQAVQRRARALYHDDRSIVRYCREVDARAAAFEKMTRTAIVLPWNAHDVMKHLDPRHRFPSQAETAVGQIAEEITFDSVWPRCEATLEMLDNRARGAVRVFDGRGPLSVRNDAGERAAELLRERRKEDGGLVHVPALPDCWVWMTADFLGLGPKPTVKEEREAVIAAALDHQGDRERLAEALRNDLVRVITISRARYNPRFRGQLVLSARAAQEILLHVALCLATSYDYKKFNLEKGELRRGTPSGTRQASPSS